MPKSNNKNKILVVGLPPGSTSADLTKLVKPIGNPIDAKMVVDAEGRERGFGFVTFNDAATQQAAIAALDKTAVAGRTLNVRAVEERAPGAGDGGAKPAGGNKGRPCFDFAKGKCARGSACRWAHIAPPAAGDTDAARSRRPDWQKKRPDSGTASESLMADIPEDICRKYQFGACHRGDACRWKHIIWRPEGAGGEEGGGGGKRAKTAAPASSKGGGHEVCQPAKPTGSSVLMKPPARIGGMAVAASPAEIMEELRGRLRQREAEWRAAHPEHAHDAPVPEEAKRRDVVWAALDRKAARASQVAE